MKLFNILSASVIALTASASAASANVFVESFTDARVGDRNDEVITTVGVGKQGEIAGILVEGVIGAGYGNIEDNGQIVYRAGGRAFAGLGKGYSVEAETNVLYYGQTNDTDVNMTARVRKFF